MKYYLILRNGQPTCFTSYKDLTELTTMANNQMLVEVNNTESINFQNVDHIMELSERGYAKCKATLKLNRVLQEIKESE